MAIRIKKKKNTKTVLPKKEEVCSDFVHWVARLVYYNSLVKGGSKNPKMEPERIDRHCSIYKSCVKDSLAILVEHGFISLEDLKIPAGHKAKAEEA